MSRIFISYRRGDSGEEARRLYQRLSSHFGKDKVGFDLEFEPGVNYVEAIRQAVGGCDVLIAVIGKQWLRTADHAGRRRLDQEDDLVRLEIKTALDRGIRVIPILVDGAGMPERRDLPEVLDQLALLQASEGNEGGVNKLIPVLERVLRKQHGTAPGDTASSTNIGTAAYLFSGHALGAAARFERLDGVENLNHVIPALAASVVPAAGGLARSSSGNYAYRADYPHQKTLLSLQRAESIAAGQTRDGRGETEVDAEVEGTAILEKLRLDRVRLHFRFHVNPEDAAPAVTTSGNQIEGLRAGDVEVTVHLDDELLTHCGSMEQLAEFYRKQSSDYRRRYYWRFGATPEASRIAPQGNLLKCSLVQDIQLQGSEKDKMNMTVDGNQIRWAGFGRIVLGEVLVDCVGPHVSMVRLQMGSDAQGVATIGEGHAHVQMRSS
jgi:hypothetical protein